MIVEHVNTMLFWVTTDTVQKMKFSIKDFSSKYDQFSRKLEIWSHILEKSLMENIIFCVVRMIADIFYPIFTLKITVLVCFIQKKLNCSGLLYPLLHQDIALDPLDSADPQLQLFLALPKTDVPIYFLYYPLMAIVIASLFFKSKREHLSN